MKNTSKKQPVHEIRIGALKATIWQNENTTGKHHNLTFSRSYKDGETWKSTSSFGRNDMLPLGKLANEAHTWIINQEATKPVAK